MGVLRTKLMLHKDITFDTKDETQEYTPNGPFSLVKASVSAAYDLNCKVSILFDGNIMFHGKGGEVLLTPVSAVGDGVKKVVLSLDAVDLPSGTATLGGEAHFEEEI